jgi:hypothetical protein
VNLRKAVDTSDVFIFLGLVLIGTGLFFWCGKGIALTVVGSLLFLLGFIGGKAKE